MGQLSRSIPLTLKLPLLAMLLLLGSQEEDPHPHSPNSESNEAEPKNTEVIEIINQFPSFDIFVKKYNKKYK
jgi:hypothetical protein